MKQLAIIGAGGHGKVVADMAEQLGYVVAFFDSSFPERTELAHWPIVGQIGALLETASEYDGAVIAIGNASVRKQIFFQLAEAAIPQVSLVHPSAAVSPYAKIGAGSVVFAGAVINAFAHIGEGCIVNTGAIVEHDCSVGSFCHICPNSAIAGGVQLGDEVWVGIGAAVIQGVTVGTHTTIGAGAAVVHNIPAGVTAVGCPAKIVKK